MVVCGAQIPHHPGMRSAIAAILLMLLLLGYGLYLRLPPSDFDVALAEVLDGSADRKLRLPCLATIRDRGLERARGGDTRAGLMAAMASLDLDDEESYQHALALVGSSTRFLPAGGDEGGDQWATDAALAEPYLRNLMWGNAAENAGDLDRARIKFRQALVSARLFGAATAASAAEDGLERVATK